MNAKRDQRAESLFVKLEKQRRQLESELNHTKEEIKTLQEQIIDEWFDRGQQSASVDGLSIYIYYDFYCSKKEEISTEQFINALRNAGWGQFVKLKYDGSLLKAFVKEQLDSKSDIPDELRQMLHYGTPPRLRTRPKR